MNVQRRATSANTLVKKLTRVAICYVARMVDFDSAMNRQQAVWQQESGRGMNQDNK